MEIRFASRAIQSLCEKAAEAKKKLGADSAHKLQIRLADLRAATTVSDLTSGKPHALVGSRDGQFAVSLSRGHRLVFVASNDPVPLTSDAAIDWRRVTIIQIEFIGDYHD